MLTVVDPDVVVSSNLTRQALYFEKDLGRKKVNVLRSRACLINRGVKVYAVEKRIRTARSLAPLIRGASVVLQCADQPDVEIMNDLVSKACFPLSMPHILCGGYDGHLSYVGQTVIPHRTSCWRCYVEGDVYERGLQGFEHVRVTPVSIRGGTLSPIACITASIHVLEAIRVISGFAKPLMVNNKAELDFLSFSFSKTKIPRKKDCSLCGYKKHERRIG
jgi:molybdopterin/thiamine biosynthesis adenylyltransferase